MKILIDGKVMKCCSFAELKAGDVFTMHDGRGGHVGVFMKTAANTMFNLCSTAHENYANQQIVFHPEAELKLEDCYHKGK